ncbi:MAG: zinc-ribbon domain [Vampirovibrio sp.]|jgi:DNA-directed RNA polymerase subunit RPC12/RpoP|nr:zinc-ribbon domain [Vampirovibrio sp.]
MTCLNCGAYLSEGEYHCPKCGAPVLQPEPEQANGLLNDFLH